MAASNDDEQSEAGTLSGLRVLVVEDSWHVATAIQSLLRSFGAEVAGPVASTADAERLLAEQLPHVAIVDINLRGGELAYGLIDKLNELAVRVIVVSGYSAPRLQQDKVAAVLQKPITEAELLAAFQVSKEQP
jgi:CheY-like chemotaxis protein